MGFSPIEPDAEPACRAAPLDNAIRDVRYAVRSFLRAPLAALTIVATVGLGLGLVAVVFTTLNAFVFRVDDVRNPHELFAVDRQTSADDAPETFTRAEYETLVCETGVFSDVFAIAPEFDARVEGISLEGHLVTGNFFEALGVSAAPGRSLTPDDDQPGAPLVIVLSHNAWSLYFDTDISLLNRPVRVNGVSVQVIGVMPEGFRGLEVVAPPDFWAPLSHLGQYRPELRGRESTVGLQVVGRLAPGMSPDQALAQLLVWDSRCAIEQSGERPPAALVLEPRRGTMPLSVDMLVLFIPLFFAFGLILMIGCANVANLLLARGVARQREIGIRLAIGASRRRVISQLLTESLLLALVSAALAFGVSRLVLTGIVYVATSTFPPDIGSLRIAVPPADWRVAVFLVAGAAISTVLFAMAPALLTTRMELVPAIRGEVVRDARPGRARDWLVALQVTGSVLLLISAAVFLRSSWTAASADPGIRTRDIVNIHVLNEERRATILDLLARDPFVFTIGASWPAIPEGLSGCSALGEGATGKSAVAYRFVSPEYFGVAGIDLVRGRNFTGTETSASASVAIVSEMTAQQLWPGLDPLGQVLRVEPDPNSQVQEPASPPPLSQSFVVVGVARDVAMRVFGVTVAGAGVYVPITAEAASASLTVRIQGDPERTRQVLSDRLAAIDPNMGEVSTLTTLARAEAYLLSVAFWLTMALGTLSLLLTLSGLFSVLSYLVQQRTREIGVRMALGATVGRIGALVLLQIAQPVGIGMLVGSTMTAALSAALLATPAAEMIGTSVRLFDVVAYAVSLLVIGAACVAAALIPALGAGRVNPVAALRQD